jgi:transcriptional regulator with XRE-family HTH domain
LLEETMPKKKATVPPRAHLLRRVRSFLGLTQRRMAFAMRVSPGTMTAWETGGARMPDARLDTLLLLLMDAPHDPDKTPRLLHAIREERGR